MVKKTEKAITLHSRKPAGIGRVILCVCLIGSAAGNIHAVKPLLLDRISLEQDSTSLERIRVNFFFSAPPASMPVYALTGPQRIVVDLTNTRARKGIIMPKSTMPSIEKLDFSEHMMGIEPNTRVEIFVKQTAGYTAQIEGKRMTITINLAGEVKKYLPLFSEEGDSNQTALASLNVTGMEKSVEVAVGFTRLPRAASVYLMQSPPRIVMDFYGVSIRENAVKSVKIPPVKSISLVKQEQDSLYTGIVIHLDRNATFRYQQIGTNMIVNIPTGSDALSMKNMLFIGGGVILAGGVATGILLGGGGEKQPQPSGPSDLGAPPPLPGN